MSTTTIKPPLKIAIFLLLAAAIYFGTKWYLKQPKEVGKAQDVGKVVIPDAPEASLTGNATKLELPSTSPALNGGVKITINEMAWQSQTSINYANGGDRTTKGSLFDKAHLDVQIVRQDDCSQTVTDFVKWTNDYQKGTTKDGFFAIFMGSGIPAYIHAMSEAVKALGPEYQPVAFLTTGKSYGEDQIIGDEIYKKNPQSLRGAVLRGVRMDGDIDLALKFCGDNGIPVNPNEQTYDASALNLSYSKDFLSAVVDYNNSNAREVRKIVVNGKTTGKDTSVGYNLVATWTPGDVNAVQKGRGGSTIISTKIYASIMPNIIITGKKFMNDNRSSLEEFVKAVVQAGDQIRSFDDIKKYATGLNAKIYNEEDPAYWYKFYNGMDAGSAHLGGSMVFNMADISKEFGLSGSSDIYKEVYNTFGKIQSALYPKDLPEFVPYNKAVDKSIMMSVLSNFPELLEGKALKVDYAAAITNKVASKSVHINFKTGSADIEPSSYATLDDIYSNAVASEGLKVGVYGYTDNTGNAEKNQLLSEERAESVEEYLKKKGLPSDRLEAKGYGQENAVADNNTAAGKAANRRVEIVLGN